jgi:hypothetical protein
MKGKGAGAYVIAVLKSTGHIIVVLTDLLGLSYCAAKEGAENVSGRLHILECLG